MPKQIVKAERNTFWDEPIKSDGIKQGPTLNHKVDNYFLVWHPKTLFQIRVWMSNAFVKAQILLLL